MLDFHAGARLVLGLIRLYRRIHVPRVGRREAWRDRIPKGYEVLQETHCGGRRPRQVAVVQSDRDLVPIGWRPEPFRADIRLAIRVDVLPGARVEIPAVAFVLLRVMYGDITRQCVGDTAGRVQIAGPGAIVRRPGLNLQQGSVTGVPSSHLNYTA